MDEHPSNSQDDGESIMSDSAPTVSSRTTNTHPTEHDPPIGYYQSRSPLLNNQHEPVATHSHSTASGADHPPNNGAQASHHHADRFAEHKTDVLSLASEVPVSTSPRESSPLRHSFTNDDNASNSPVAQRSNYSHQSTMPILPSRPLTLNHRWASPSLLAEKSFASLDDTAPPYDGYPFIHGNTKKVPIRIRSSPRSSLSPPRYRDGRSDINPSQVSPESADIIDTEDIKWYSFCHLIVMINRVLTWEISLVKYAWITLGRPSSPDVATHFGTYLSPLDQPLPHNP